MSADDIPPNRANRSADAIEDIERNVTRLREFHYGQQVDSQIELAKCLCA